MTARPWMPLYVAEYMADTAHLGALESGAYLHLIFYYWRTGGLPAENKELARIAKVSAHCWKKLCPVIQKFFHDGWKHKRVEKELAKASDISEKRSAAANSRRDRLPASERANAELLQTHLHLHLQEEESKKEPSLRSGAQSTVATVPRETPDDWPKDFRERFWTAYPRKVGKGTALRCLERVRKSGIAFDRIIAGIERIPKQDLQFVPHPATWLGRGGWDDEEIPGESNGHRGSRPLQDDRLSLGKAADRLIEQAERGEFSFGPRPSLSAQSSENDLRLLPKG